MKQLQKMTWLLALAITSSLMAMDLKIATLYPDGTAEVVALRQAGRDIAAATDNRVRFQVYPGGAMGDDTAVKRRIRTGQLQGALIQTGALAGEYRDVQILNAPFTLQTYQEVDAVRAELQDDIIAGLADNGIKSFGFIDGGFAYIMTQSPVSSLDDLQQQRLWLPAGDPFSERIAREFRISPILLGLGEVLTSLQTGAINAVVAPPSAALTLQWHNRLTHVTDMPLIYTLGTLYVDGRAFARLSASDQQAVESILVTMTQQLNQRNRGNNIAAYEALQQQGIVKVVPNAEQIAEITNNADRVLQLLVDTGAFNQVYLDRLQATLAGIRAN